MRRISLRERQILHLRFAEDLTQAEIGEPIGLSQMQISRIIPQALARLEVSAEPSVAAASTSRWSPATTSGVPACSSAAT